MLPRNTSTPNFLEDMSRVLAFLAAGLCGPRETPLDDNALCGALLIFWALSEDIEAHINNS